MPKASTNPKFRKLPPLARHKLMVWLEANKEEASKRGDAELIKELGPFIGFPELSPNTFADCRQVLGITKASRPGAAATQSADVEALMASMIDLEAKVEAQQARIAKNQAVLTRVINALQLRNVIDGGTINNILTDLRAD